MEPDDATRQRPEYTQLEELYGQLGIGPKKRRSFGGSLKVFALSASGDAWLDSQIGYLKTTTILQFCAIALTVVGVLLYFTRPFGSATGLVLVVPVTLGIWSLLRAKNGAKAFFHQGQP
ncbi:MAG TPA: hypothetical protein VM325_12030 [Alphaproteobacteria bacterium]|nr:hypothetical protein [Alphaproteobacteria bacterium]